MIIATHNASEEQLWKWFTIPGDDGEVELKLITRDELTSLGKSKDLSVQAKTIAKHFFRDFKNMVDANGVAIPNTEEQRVKIQTYRPIFNFIIDKLTDLGAWSEEGKGVSGSAS